MKLWDEEFYSKKLIFKYLRVFVVMGVLMALTKGVGFVVLVPLSFLALMRRDALTLFYCIFLSTISLVTNGILIPKGLTYTVTQRGMMVVLGFFTVFQIFGQRQSPYLKPLLGLLVYILYMIGVSQQGYSPIISNLKLFLYTTTFLAYYSASTTVTNSSRVDIRSLRSMVLALGIFFLIGSVLVIPFPRISMMVPKDAEEMASLTSLFKGMTNHSQEMGPAATMLGILIMADWFFSVQKKNTLYTLILITVPFLIYKTSSRTAMGALLAGIGFLTYCVMISRGVRRTWKGKVISNMLMVSVLAAACALAVPHVREGVVKFALKYSGDNAQVDREEVFKTRQGKWDASLEGWRQNPYFGNGFQVSYEMQGFSARSYKDVLTAPVEKSTWIYAVLEEGGTIGMIIFCLFVLSTLVTMMRLHAYIGATLFVTMLILNLGELSIFAMSGMGGFMWALIMMGLVFDQQRNKQATGVRPYPGMGYAGMPYH